MIDPQVSFARKAAPNSDPSKFGALVKHKPSELAARKGKVIVVAGRSNAGKTTLLKTLWDSDVIKTVAIADARGRTHVLPDLDGLDIFEIKTGTDQNAFRDAFKAQPTAYDVVCIDTYSEWQAIDLKYKGLYTAQDKDRLKIYSDSHMDMSDTTREIYDIAMEYGTHVIITLWLDKEKDPKTNADITTLYLTGKFETYFRGIVDYIALLELNDPPSPYPPVLNFSVSNRTPQKFSPSVEESAAAATIPKSITNPSLGVILDVICGRKPYPK